MQMIDDKGYVDNEEIFFEVFSNLLMFFIIDLAFITKLKSHGDTDQKLWKKTIKTPLTKLYFKDLKNLKRD